jgi:hypothetical protein
MARHPRRVAAVLVLVGASVALALLLGSTSKDGPTAVKAGTARPAHEALLERGRGGTEEADGAAAQAYTDRAYPASEVTIAEIQGAIKADAKLKRRGPKLFSKWESLGPDTLDVDRLGTQSFIKPTQWSGRLTAVTAGLNCDKGRCPLYVAAAGGGVWQTKDALEKKPNWKQISEDIPTNAIGSIAVDPNDPTGKTIYAGTGEGNASGDSEAGLGLYKSTDEGRHWSLVPGSPLAANSRSIVWVAIEPGNANHILIGTRSGTRGEGSNSTSVGAVGAPLPALGVWASTDGGATFSLVLPGTANEVKFDPGSSSTVYATLAGSATGGLLRSTSGGAVGTWTPIFQENRSRFSFAPVALPNGKTRIYLGDANGGGQGAQVYRIDDASQPAGTLTASGPCVPATSPPTTCANAAWTRLSNPNDGTSGFAVYNYCVSAFGGQCSYDMFVMSPPERPDMVVVGGLMQYPELKPYVHQVPEDQVVGMRSNGRAVLMSADAGATWTDMTGDVGGESMHPDQHALAFAPGDPDRFFVGSDGGLIRTSGEWADASSQCDTRDLPTARDLADCHMWLSRIPSELQVMNAGLATLQMYSISVSPYKPDNTAMTGTQDNGTLSFTGSKRWYLPLTGDGCDSGFDAVDPHLRFHTYTNGLIDVNYNDADPTTWLWVNDFFYLTPPEPTRFCAPVLADTVRTKTLFIGAQSIWRTTDAGGDRSFLEQHCNTAVGEEPSDLLYTGACGTAADWPKLGTSALTNSGATSPYGTTKGGNTISALARAQDGGTMWAGTGSGRVLISRNVNDDPASVTFTRIDTALQPGRAVSSIYADRTNPNHAIVTFSGYNVTTVATPGHVFDVVYNPTAGTATWTDISHDLGDQPINDAVIDTDTGNIYVSTDFGVNLLEHGTQTWAPVAEGLPLAAVSGLTITDAKHGPARFIYAATHGRGAYRIRLH